MRKQDIYFRRNEILGNFFYQIVDYGFGSYCLPVLNHRKIIISAHFRRNKIEPLLIINEYVGPRYIFR